MNSNNSNEKKNFKLDKQSGANIVLAFTVVCFMLTMFFASGQVGTSYAVDTTSATPPQTLTFTGSFLDQSGASNYWQFMGGSLAIGYDLKVSGASKEDVYCVEGQVGVKKDITSYSNPVAISDDYAPGLAFILNNSYPTVDNGTYTKICKTYYEADETSKNNCQKYLTQYAIWYYLDQVEMKDSNENTQLTTEQRQTIENLSQADTAMENDIAQAVLKLANNAVIYNRDNRVETTLSIDKSAIKYNITEDGKYLESNEIAVTTNKESQFTAYIVNLNNNTYGATVVTSNGTEQTTYTKGNNFKIRIPVDKLKDLKSIDLGIAVTASFKSDVVYEYETTTPAGNQKPVIPMYTTVSTNAGITLNIPLTKIIKTDITNASPVEGAVLIITTTDGRELERWTTTKDPHYVSLNPGNYYLTEETSPDGYELNKESIAFTIDDTSNITTVEMKNTPTTPVPDTAENIPIYLYIIGGMILVIGVGVIYATTKPKKK